MRHLFDTEKSKKSIRLVKQLQDLEEKAFEIEQRKKKQQELDDEAIARALQAEMEAESSSSSSQPPPPPTTTSYTSTTSTTSTTVNTTSNNNNNNNRNNITSPRTNPPAVNYSPPSRNSNAPPPLPVKPQAYNHPDTNSPIPRPLTPLYSMNPSTPSLPPRENRAKSYLPTYESGVNVSISTPQVSAAARPQTPVTSAAPNGFMNMPEPERNYAQRKETSVQHKAPESVPHYNSSSTSYSNYHPHPHPHTTATSTPPSSTNAITAATPKPTNSNTNPFYNIPQGSTVNMANQQRPTESAPSVVFDQQYPTMQLISAPNYNSTASHSAPSLSHEKPLNEQHHPVMSSKPISFDSAYNLEPKKQGGFVEPFHVVSNNAHPPSRANHQPFTEFTSSQWQNQQPQQPQHQQQHYYQNAPSASTLEGYPTSQPKRSSFVESSVVPPPSQQQYHHQNASSASLLEGYPTSRPKRTSFVESSQQQRPPLGVYHSNPSSTHLSSTASFQNVVNSIPENSSSSFKTTAASTPFHKPPSAEKTATTSYENTRPSPNNNTNNNTTTTATSTTSPTNTTSNTTTTSQAKDTSQSSIPRKPTRPLPSIQPITSTTSLPVESQARPVSKKSAFSDSVLSLKPDENDVPIVQNHEEEDEEEDDEWDIVSPSQQTMESDKESEYDYSDMVYDRRNEATSNDPFADSFAVSHGRTPKASPPASIKNVSMIEEDDEEEEEEVAPKTPFMSKTPPAKAKTIIIEPTLISLSKQDKILDGEEEEIHRHVEKESQEIETNYQTPRVNYQTPKIDPLVYQTPATVYQTPHIDPAIYQTPHPATYQTPHINPAYPTGEEIQQFYPTNMLKAGAPPVNSCASEVSTDDYGYYQEDSKNKNLPKLPEKSDKEDRHITVASVNPGQRVWIRVHPTDTGKELAERIHIVASYKTQRVIKITTASGRSVPLDNSPVFEDWDEIVTFKEGERWKVDWGMLNPSYIDIISEGKEFMKQLKANFKSSS